MIISKARLEETVSRIAREYEEVVCRNLHARENQPDFNYSSALDSSSHVYYLHWGMLVGIRGLLPFEDGVYCDYVSHVMEQLRGLSDRESEKLLEISRAYRLRLLESPVFAPTKPAIETVLLPFVHSVDAAIYS